MSPNEEAADDLLRELRERAKELDCFYSIEEALRSERAPVEEVFRRVVRLIPNGWSQPEACHARLIYNDSVFQTPSFRESPWFQSAPVTIHGDPAGTLEVHFIPRDGAPNPAEGEVPFLESENKLIHTIADRLGHFLVNRQLRETRQQMESARRTLAAGASRQWAVIVDLLKRTDRDLLQRITRKMANHLAWKGYEEAIELLRRALPEAGAVRTGTGEENVPLGRRAPDEIVLSPDETFGIAEKHLSEGEVIACIHKWIKEDKASFLVNAIESRNAPVADMKTAISRYHRLGPDTVEFPESTRKGLLVSMIQRFFTERSEFVNMAKRYVKLEDFFALVERVVSTSRSHGKLGGKSAGLFMAMAILREVKDEKGSFAEVRVPKTWYLASDSVLEFIRFNSLDDVYNQKYVDLEQVRQEYPHIVQVFKNSRFPIEIVEGLSVVLDDLEGSPIIVRSSSLLEDQYGAAFSGKYKSLFLANVGTKRERMAALLDAVAEVYASTFGPDPIEYRIERNLIDVYEEMGIMIQEVVGRHVGDYFLPAFAGVAFSHNEFRWSARIAKKDGLLRLVPGLGTRAVDRLKDDYPVLLAPGQPGLRVNATPDEVMRYSPRFIDVINTRTGSFETLEIRDLLKEIGDDYPMADKVFSVYGDDQIKPPSFGTDYQNDDLVVTFEGLVRNTPFMDTMKRMLATLEHIFDTPVDIEFASDGKDFYLLQCRPQSSGGASQPSQIPKDLHEDCVVFTANRYVSNGKVAGITHIVYVDPFRYTALAKLSDLKAVGQAVSRLNNILPKRRFILMGPGRWGSRGDIKLGVNVTYSDINNTAVLIEIARKKGGYVPDLSFGTHFFQDLVESSIRYLPLYPDDEGILFNEEFLLKSESILPRLLPEFESISDVVRVIDVSAETGGRVLRILMNADQDRAVGVLMSQEPESDDILPDHCSEDMKSENHWKWRMRFAEQLAAGLEGGRFGVKAFYLIGSTKNATADPDSDVDIMLHVTGNEQQMRDLKLWLEGWSLCLDEVNFLRTGHRSGGLLDVHYITDEEIRNRSGLAAKIDAITDAAREVPMGKAAR